MKHAYKLSTLAIIVLSLFPIAQAQAAWTGTIDGSGGSGATAEDGTVGNTLTIKDGANVTGSTYAAVNDNEDPLAAQAFENITVNVTGGTISSTVIGARSWKGSAAGIRVNMTGGEVKGSLGTLKGFAAVYSDTADVSDVVVTISGGSFSQSNLYAATHARNATDITLRLDGGTFTNTRQISGVHYIHGTADNVLLEVNDGVTIKNDRSDRNGSDLALRAASVTSEGTSRNATLRINGGVISSVGSNGKPSGYMAGTILDGSYESGFTVENSTVEVNGGSITVGKLTGFYYDDAYDGNMITNARAIINAGDVTATTISGAYLYASGNDTESASVTINGGTIKTEGIYGATHWTGPVGAPTVVGETTVNINGGTFEYSGDAEGGTITVAGTAKDDGTIGGIAAEKTVINLNASGRDEGLDLSALSVTKGNVAEGLLNVSGKVSGLDSVNDFEVLTIASESSLVVNNETQNVDKIVVMEESSFKTQSLKPADADTPIEIYLADTKSGTEDGKKISTSEAFNGRVTVTGGGTIADSADTASGAVENVLNALDFGGAAPVDSITVEEGELAPGFTASPDGEGGFVVTEGVPNTGQDAYRSVRALNLATLRHETNDLSKRMGELRLSPEGVGSWARIYGTEMEYGAQSITTRNTSIQIGTDVDVGSGWKVGAAYSYTKSEFSGGANDGDSDLHAAGVYGAWMSESGRFADFMLKAGKLSTDFRLNGYDGSYDNLVVIASAEYGRLFKPAEAVFLEPQVELTYAWVPGDDFRAGRTVTVHQDDYQSLIGRLGVRAGFEFPNERSTVYARLSGAYEMMGEDEYRAVADAGRTEVIRTDLGGGWIEYALGANFRLTPNTYAWVDLEKSAGGDVRENYRYTLGCRYVW